ncbi:hypothetical protein CYMTET_32258 [Cymbomonas tetramitiformis]|uniref:Cyclic nucleotide-binding domain-containing protein n=1 Tax=Cymbomonas tetramitiformis TaxID=36881 RepID=A0AAE0KSE5_9CHLO|nr:hypothetical protein CYMTET_32258 [Cymbomonas tetramitiformis]
MTIGETIAFFTTTAGVHKAVKDLARAFFSFQTTSGSLKSVASLLQDNQVSFPKATRIVSGDVKVKHVSLTFDPPETVDEIDEAGSDGASDKPSKAAKGVTVLRDISVTIPSGQKVAVVGRPGCGKTSFLQCLVRVQIPSTGEISIGNHHINTVDISASISTMTQDTQSTLFDASVYTNIAVGDEDDTEAFTREQVTDIATKLGILGTPQSQWMLPQGLDTNCSRLSNALRQKIRLARTMIRERSILVLDEPLSAQDVEQKANFKEILKSMQWDKTEIDPNTAEYYSVRMPSTVIMATKDMKLLPYFDTVIYMDRGQIMETGSLEDLNSSRGPFSMYSSNKDAIRMNSAGIASISPDHLRLSSWVLNDANLEDLVKLADKFINRRVAADDVVYQEGEPATTYYIVAEGMVSFRDQDKDHQIRQRSVCSSGSLDEKPLYAHLTNSTLDDFYRSTAFAEEDTIMLALSQDDFMSVIYESPELAKAVARGVEKVESALSPEGLQQSLWPLATIPRHHLEAFGVSLPIEVLPPNTELMPRPGCPLECAYIIVKGQVVGQKPKLQPASQRRRPHRRAKPSANKEAQTELQRLTALPGLAEMEHAKEGAPDKSELSTHMLYSGDCIGMSLVENPISPSFQVQCHKAPAAASGANTDLGGEAHGDCVMKEHLLPAWHRV